jgi:hypothetical protein
MGAAKERLDKIRRASVMRVPSIPYRESSAPEDGGPDRVLLTMFSAGVVMSLLIWGLAIAKAIDLYGNL